MRDVLATPWGKDWPIVKRELMFQPIIGSRWRAASRAIVSLTKAANSSRRYVACQSQKELLPRVTRVGVFRNLEIPARRSRSTKLKSQLESLVWSQRWR
jgi:hypothetical protein